MADVPALRDAFARGDDIHSMTATELFGEVTRDTRAQAKTINFAILYGISRWGLAGRLDVTPDEAQDRKSVVSGKSVSVRVDLGGRRIIKTKKNHKHTTIMQ